MVGVLQYDRGVRLTVIPPVPVDGSPALPVVVNPIPPPGAGAPALPQLRIRFTVRKSITPEPQRATVEVWNLQKTTRDSIAGAARRVIDWIPGGVSTPLVSIDGRLRPADPIVVNTTGGVAHMVLEVGYGAALSTLFEGVAAPVRNRRMGPTWRTTLHGGDGELQLTQGVGGKSFEPGTPASVVLTYFATVLGLVVVPTAGSQLLSGYILQNGFVANGRARDGVSDLLNALQLTWWVEDGQLWILAEGEFVPGPPVFCSPEDIPGFIRLLEAPMRLDDGGVRCKMQLASTVRPGHTLIIVSSELAGNYRIESATHTGDNRFGPFNTQAVVRNQAPI